ncbi:hypothetical protein ACJX0J_007012, partial [Zea mays]
FLHGLFLANMLINAHININIEITKCFNMFYLYGLSLGLFDCAFTGAANWGFTLAIYKMQFATRSLEPIDSFFPLLWEQGQVSTYNLVARFFITVNMPYTIDPFGLPVKILAVKTYNHVVGMQGGYLWTLGLPFQCFHGALCLQLFPQSPLVVYTDDCGYYNLLISIICLIYSFLSTVPKSIQK